jgi:hypothetical protein
MPVMIDVEKEAEVPVGMSFNLEDGIPLILTKDQKDEVVLRKYISTNGDRADWQPKGIWFEQVVSDVGGTGRRRRARITLAGLSGEERSVMPDDGLIIDLHGTTRRNVGILPGRSPMDEEQIDAYIDQTDELVPTFQEWEFRVVRVLKTNGPEGRAMLAKSEDQKRKTAEAGMFEAIQKAFEQGQIAANSGGNISPNAQETFDEGTKKG